MSEHIRSAGIGKGLRHPAAIVLALLTIAAGLVALPWAIPLGLAWGLTVYFASQRTSPRRGPAVDLSALPPTIQRDLFEVRQALAEIRATVATAAPERQVLLQDVLREAADVEQAVGAQALAAGRLHDYLAATVHQPASAEREQMLALLQRYRAMMAETVAAAQKLRSSVQLLVAGQLADYDSEQAPARQMDEMKASVAALEEIMRTSSLLH